ncbi:MAG TPA: alpha/beta hydrolase [Jatrophihabitans sp.]|nr:alpha/beta hydrolase [Jatrophihabitans sp.]
MFDRAQLTAAAGVDPWAQLDQLRAGDPDQIEELAAAFYRAGGDTKDASHADAQATQYARDGYTVQGAAPIDYNAEAKRTSTSLADASDKLPKIAKVLSAVAEELAGATESVDGNVRDLDSALAKIESGYDSDVQVTGHAESLADRQDIRAGYLHDAVATVRSYGTSTTKAVSAYEQSLATATKSMSDLGYVPPAALQEAGEPTKPLPVGTDPRKVAKWWASLTPAQQRYLIEHNYQTLGRLRGLPAGVLDVANRRRVEEHTASLKREITVAEQQDPTGSVAGALRAEVEDDEALLNRYLNPGPGGPPRYLLAYEPNGVNTNDGHPSVAISYGNPDTAANTAVMVPGTGSNMTKLGGGLGADANSLYHAMSGQSKAVVVWLDGREPPTLPDAASDSWANAASPKLVSDINGLRAAHTEASGDPGHLAAIGHSYGSYILGKAMTQGAQADDVAFIGSPGVGVNHASDLGVDPSHVWDGAAEDDPILGPVPVEHRFTPDPMTGNNPEESDFGAQHFSVGRASGHSEYYKDPESLGNLARIADGGYVHRVPAPNYRSGSELAGDAIASVVNPVDTTIDAAGALVTGHPIDAVTRQAGGMMNEGEDVLKTAMDVGQAAEPVAD